MNSYEENIFQDDDELAIFEVFFEYLKQELDKILVLNQKRKNNPDNVNERKKFLADMLNIGDECKLNDLAVENVSIDFISFNFFMSSRLF